ncbi:MAG: rRNA maturation RNase YbeY [Clostridia bacterium]|nr:rRNA maturation RNase YbeY [Clostridia bacterium]
MINIFTSEPEELFDKVAASAFETLKLSGDAMVELVFYNEQEIRELNLQTRGIDKSTDVLSYPNLDEIKPFARENYPFDFDEETNCVFLGSIVICEQIAKLQAQEYGHSVVRERAYLFLHGLLHLLGYDHMDEADKKVMREKEEAVLSDLGVYR